MLRGCGGKGTLLHGWWSVGCDNHYGEQHAGVFKKVKIELPYDPTIPLLGIYLEQNMIQKNIYTTMFIVALFTIANIWKQPICPSTEERIKKM